VRGFEPPAPSSRISGPYRECLIYKGFCTAATGQFDQSRPAESLKKVPENTTLSPPPLRTVMLDAYFENTADDQAEDRAD
jgi:hypothetical protein